MSQSTDQATDGKLGTWDAASIIVGIVIGTTIFELPWLIFANTPNPWAGLAVWVFGGVLALVGGLCYAELGTTYDVPKIVNWWSDGRICVEKVK